MSLIIDAGHQGVGIDPGAVGNGIIESDLVLQISLYQFNRFKELAVPVKMTRTQTQKLTNTERANIVKNSGMKHCISNHINAGGGDGAEVIYSIYSKPNFAQVVLDGLTAVGQNPRKIFTRKSNNSHHDYFYMHRDTGKVETLIVEYGFLDSKKDDVHQLKTDWKKYAEAVVKAYCSYAGYKYIEPSKPQKIIHFYTGGYASGSLLNIHDFIRSNNWYFEPSRDTNGSLFFSIGGFGEGSEAAMKLENFLKKHSYWYQIRTV